MPTLREHEAELRTRCHNGTLYRNDEKLAAWLAVPVEDVPGVLAELANADVLRFDGESSKGTERYKLGLPSQLTAEARRLYRAMLSASTASDVVNVTNLQELAQLASLSTDRTRSAFGELRSAHLVTEKTLGDHRFPVILRRIS
ncbi:hypothetical protein [Mycolicibacterium gilvum]|uniref:hypothetical protein n=1 Tax=Mycolicibacterium gilvum TaxID=1804 RepID=UPI004045A12C